MPVTNSPSHGRHTLWVLGLALAIGLAPVICSAGEIPIEIAPATLNLASNGKVVTVHADIPYTEVTVYTVYLSGVAINSWKADDRGDFVAKFLIDDVQTIDGLVINDTNTFRFVAMTIYDEPVWGVSEVMVIDRGSRPTNRESDVEREWPAD